MVLILNMYKNIILFESIKLFYFKRNSCKTELYKLSKGIENIMHSLHLDKNSVIIIFDSVCRVD